MCQRGCLHDQYVVIGKGISEGPTTKLVNDVLFEEDTKENPNKHLLYI